jgi:hypothetical protein
MNVNDQINQLWNDLMIHCECKNDFPEEEYIRVYDDIIRQINQLQEIA